jgi:uncharacterized protein (TIGR02246 family)
VTFLISERPPKRNFPPNTNIHMKLSFLIMLIFPFAVFAQSNTGQGTEKIKFLISQYAEARETQDSTLLRSLLTEDIDQLVSNGQWRSGIKEAIAGMQTSTRSNPGTRELAVDKIKFLSEDVALVDCRYIITNPNGSKREMWSSFSVIKAGDTWRISAIRNMSPSGI